MNMKLKIPNLKTKDMLLIIVFILILASPFVKVALFSNEIVKVVFLLLIVGITFYDLKLAILVTVLFLILVINSPTQKEKYTSIKNYWNTDQEENSIVKLIDISTAPLPKATCPGAPNADKEKINDNMFDLFFDPKIKPFENIISEITGCEKLLDAQNNTVGGYIAPLQPHLDRFA